MLKPSLRKRGISEAARRALAAATSGESSAASIQGSGLPLGVARAGEVEILARAARLLPLSLLSFPFPSVSVPFLSLLSCSRIVGSADALLQLGRGAC